MKIALLTEKYTPDIGGLAISSERFAGLLSSAGHKVRIFSPTPNLPPSEKRTLPSGGVSITRFGAHKRMDDTLVHWFELISEGHKHEPFDVLHAYFLTQAGFVASYAGKYLNVPSVVSVRGNDIERAAFDPSRFSQTIYALQNGTAVTTNASELVKKAKAFVDREVILIPNGVDTDHFKPGEKHKALAESLGLNQGPIIGFVGELREKKGLRPLLSSYMHVYSKIPATLLIIGEVRQGEDKQAFDEFRSSVPDSQIIVTGVVPHKDLPTYYSLIDVFVHPSLRDGMPNALLEAMSCERAIVATPVGGVLDILEDGINGMLVPVNDPGLLAEKVLELLADSSLRSQLGKQARATIAERFTPDKELEANLEAYRKIGLHP